MAVHGQCGPDQVLSEGLADEAVRQLAATVEVYVDREIQRQFPATCLGEVIIHTRDGRTLASGAVQARGDADHPLDEGELAAKFIQFVSPVTGKGAASELVAASAAIHEDDGPQRLWTVLQNAL